MSRHEKLLQRLRDPKRDASWNFTELCQLLQKIGFEMRASPEVIISFGKPGW